MKKIILATVIFPALLMGASVANALCTFNPEHVTAALPLCKPGASTNEK
jgi:hypothetical protein